MNERPRLVLTFDGGGASSGGPGGWGAVLQREGAQRGGGTIIEERNGYLDDATNNDAEYTGLIRGVEMALEYAPSHLHIAGDSMLVICQVTPRWWNCAEYQKRRVWTRAEPPVGGIPVQPFVWKCKDPRLRRLQLIAVERIRAVVRQGGDVTLEWQKGHTMGHIANDRADKLATRAIRQRRPHGALPV